MAAGSTYTPIATTTLGSSQTNVTFSSFAGYTDIHLVISSFTASGSSNVAMQFNTDTGNNYSFTRMYDNGSAVGSSRAANVPDNYIGDMGTTIATVIVDLMSYANTNVNKTCLVRSNVGGSNVQAWVNLWRNTGAITSIKIYNTGGQSFAAGSMFTLYGLAAA
jgi:hypothetical protein